MSELAPQLWSDFDGTAVGIASKADPRNWSKYPLPGLKGYANFLQGIQSTGVEIAGIVSRRPDILIRRLATARSVSKLGYGNFFKQDQIIHKGSEEAKGRFIADQSRHATIGMIEDKPHKLGAVLLGVLSEPARHPDTPHHPIMLGVVSHDRSQEYLERLVEQAKSRTNGDLYVSESVAGAGSALTAGFRLEAESLTLHVTQLDPYSEQAGRAFGRQILDIAKLS